MQLPSFRKPVYKPLLIVTVLLALATTGLAAIDVVRFIWLAPVFLCSLFILSWGVFSIQSGIFVSAINKVRGKQKQIAITFDDGPHENTPELLRILKKHNAQATFFVVGRNAEKHPAILQQIHNEGHEIGNHTYHHATAFPGKKVSAMIEDIASASIVIKKIIGEQPKTFRPPFGITNPNVAKAIRAMHLKTIGWSVRSLDTQIKSSDKIVRRIIKKTKPGSIILLHDYTEHSSLVLEHILSYFAALNFNFVSISDLTKE